MVSHASDDENPTNETAATLASAPKDQEKYLDSSSSVHLDQMTAPVSRFKSGSSSDAAAKEPFTASADEKEECNLHSSSTRNTWRSKVSFITNSRLYKFFFPDKLGVISGVYVPNMLNTYGVILWTRFAYLLGKAGFFWSIVMLLFCYLMNFLTTASLSAIATNGKMQPGGVYFIISRILGPEVGAAAGVALWLANLFGGVLDAFGFVETLRLNFPAIQFSDYWDTVLYTSIVIFFAMLIGLMGAGIFSKVSVLNILLIFLAMGTMVVTLLFQTPGAKEGAYTGLKTSTFAENFTPDWSFFSLSKTFYNLQPLFGVIYPSSSGFLAGFNLSADLRHPTRDLPTGTMLASLTTFVSYAVLLTLMAFTIRKESLINNLNVMTEVSLFEPFQLLGILTSTFMACFMSFLSCSRILQAVAKDELLPFTKLLGKGFGRNKEPFAALIFTWFLAQCIVFMRYINFVSPFVTLFFILVHFVCHASLLLLILAYSPNFRPSFKIYSPLTAILGGIFTMGSVYYMNYLYATISIFILMLLLLVVFFWAPSKSWGSLGKSLIYYQTRKYNLKMDDRYYEHVRFWRFKALLLVSNPRSSYDVLSFFHSLTKHRGGFGICGHVDTGNFRENVVEHEKQSANYFNLIRAAKWNLFTNCIHSVSIREGARSLLSSLGLALMQPNSLVLGFYENDAPKQRIINTKTKRGRKIYEALSAFPPLRQSGDEHGMSLDEYFDIVKDTILLKKNLVITRNFDKLAEMQLAPQNVLKRVLRRKEKYIDIWLLCLNVHNQQIEATIGLILQLSFLITRSGNWKNHHNLRISCLINSSSNYKEEKARVKNLLKLARIKAKLRLIEIEDEDFEILQSAPHDQKIDLTKLPHGHSDEFAVHIPDLLNDSEFTSTMSETELEEVGDDGHFRIARSKDASSLQHQTVYEKADSSKEDTQKDNQDEKTPKTLQFAPHTFSIGDVSTHFPPTIQIFKEDGTRLDERSKYRVINHIIRSNASDSSLTLITLPPPPVDFDDSDSHIKYHNCLDNLTHDLGATMLVYGYEQTISVLV